MAKKKTTLEFIQEANSKYKNLYDYSKTVYVNSHTDVCVTCRTHGDFWVNPIKHLSRNQGCPKCSGRTNWSFEKFFDELNNRLPHYLDNIEILNYNDICTLSEDSFKIEKTEIWLKCKIDGYTWKSCGRRMLLNQGCRKCSGSLKFSKDDFLNQVKEKNPDILNEYTIVGEYKNTKTPFIVKCNDCGYEFGTTPSYFRDGKTKCPNCKDGNIYKHTVHSISEKLKNTNWELLDNIDEHKSVNSRKEKLHFKCKKCGYIIETTFLSIRSQGYLCPNCDENARTHTRSYYENKMIEKFNLNNVDFVWDNGTNGAITDRVKGTDKFKIIDIDDNENVIYYGSFRNGITRDKLGFNRLNIEENIKIAEDNAKKKNITIISDLNDIKSNYDSIRLKCEVCGYEWDVKASSVIYNQFGCKRCHYTNLSSTSSSFFLSDKLSILESSDLEIMSEHQLIELIGQDILPREFKVLTRSEGGSKQRRDDIRKLREKLTDKTKTEEEIGSEIEQEVEELDETEIITNELLTSADGQNELDKNNLPQLTTQELKIFDKYYKSYGEKNEYISKESINRIWNCVLSDDSYLKELKTIRKDCGEWLKYIIKAFLTEYKEVINIQADSDYKFVYEPSLMQKLMEFRIANNPYYGNWCGTGAGKTNAFLIASRRINARVTVCVCPNSVVDTIKQSIIAVYPNSNIVIVKSLDDIVSYDRKQFNYIIFNYEKFSQSYSREMVEKLISLNRIDFICFDEVHRTKNTESLTNRNLAFLRMNAQKSNGNLKVLGMTATPLINNLGEVRTLLELVTGTSFAEFIPNTKNTIGNIHNAYKYLMLYGFRYVPDYDIACNEEIVPVTNDELTDQLLNFKNSDVNDIEGLFVKCKYEKIKNYIRKHKTIIYTQFIKKLVPNIKKELKNGGITFREYTGDIDSEERNRIISDFGSGEFDVILASSPITTGVDGLQKYCDNIIIMSLPWTNAEYTQLIGRINRQGSEFKQVNIIIPQVSIRLDDGTMWSWDKKRFAIIKSKQTLSDAVVDGKFASVFNLNRKKLLNDAIESLKRGISDFTVVRKELEVNCSLEACTREYKDSVINDIHRKANTSTSSHMNGYFTSNPDKWKEYHKIREENKKTWVEDPLDAIAEKLNKPDNNNRIIADLGCGMNQLKDKVKNYSEWYSFDHYSEDETVIKADIANLKEHLADNSVDIAVFCMSLWGTNYMDYIKEAYRYLKIDGIMHIVEPKDKVNQAVLFGGAAQFGFNLIDIVPERNGKTYLEFKKMK